MHHTPTTPRQLGGAALERLLRETISEFRVRGFLEALTEILTDELDELKIETRIRNGATVEADSSVDTNATTEPSDQETSVPETSVPESWIHLEQCLLSDQLSARSVDELLASDPSFARWLRARAQRREAAIMQARTAYFAGSTGEAPGMRAGETGAFAGSTGEAPGMRAGETGAQEARDGHAR